MMMEMAYAEDNAAGDQEMTDDQLLQMAIAASMQPNNTNNQ